MTVGMEANGRHNPVLQAALEYASYGWRVIPTKPSTKRPYPRLTDWPNLATTDEDQIIAWWTEWPEANVGVQMCQESNLLDIECDSPAAEQLLIAIFGDVIPYTATYSAARGKHRLFRWSGELPNAHLAYWKIGPLEFRPGGKDPATGRIKGCQSVFPPSIHPSGVRYKWDIPPSEGIMELPEAVLAAVWNSGGEDIFTPVTANGRHQPSIRMELYTQEEIPEGSRDNTIYAEACEEWRIQRRDKGHNAFTDPKVQGHIYERMWMWNRFKCKPPLTDQEIHAKVESAKKFLQNQKFEEKQEASLTTHGLEFRDGEWWPGSWEVTVILSKPAVYLLKVPAWSDLLGEDDVIELSADVYRDAAAVAQAIFMATKTVIVDSRPGFWPAIWNGSQGSKKDLKPPTVGLKAKLVDVAKTQEAPGQWKRPVVVAEMLAEKLAVAQEKEEPDKRGKPVRMPDGTIWLRWSKAWEDEISLKKVTAVELQQLGRSIGLEKKDSRRYPNKGDANRLRYFVLTPAHIGRLNEIRESTPGEPDYAV